MSEKSKTVIWLNTIRVFSAFTIIVSHFAALSSFKGSLFRWCFAGSGHVGVFLFFAISGYLAAFSLRNHKSVLEFYRRKFIRIIIPFIVAYMTLSIIFILLGIVDPKIMDRTPITSIIFGGDEYFKVLIGMLPSFRYNIPIHIDMKVFIGEWFIGTVFCMYVISPILYKFLCKRPCIVFVISIILSILLIKLPGVGWWHFLVRLPEFLLGMILCIHSDFFERYDKKIIYIASAMALIVVIGFFLNAQFKGHIIFWGTFLSDKPKTFLLSVPLACLIFRFSQYLNEKISLQWFNQFSDISYVAMLIQHVIINFFGSVYDMSSLSVFGIIFMIALLVLVIVKLSWYIYYLYKPISEYLIKKFKVT